MNPFVAEVERRKNQDSAGGKGSSYDRWGGGRWNDGGKGGASSEAPVTWVRLYKNDIIDMRCYKYDKRGNVITVDKDQYAHVVSAAFHVPATDREMIVDGVAVPVLITGHSKKPVNRVIAEIVCPKLTLDLTVNQAKVVARVLDFTYAALGVRQRSIQSHAQECYGTAASKIRTRIESRLLQEKLVKEKALSSDEDDDEGDDDDGAEDRSSKSVSARNASFVQGLNAAASSTGPAVPTGAESLPAELAAGIKQLIENFDKKSTNAAHFNLGTPNPAEKKRQRSLRVVRGAPRDVGAEMDDIQTDAQAAQTGGG